MLAAFLAIALDPGWWGVPAAHRQRPPIVLVDQASGALRDALTARFAAMNARDQGIFHEDVSSIVDPFFPPGQPFAETQRVVAQQGLGRLRPYRGKGNGDGRMFVAKLNLMSQMFSDVYVVLDFDFTGPSRDLVLRSVSAYLQASNM